MCQFLSKFAVELVEFVFSDYSNYDERTSRNGGGYAFVRKYILNPYTTKYTQKFYTSSDFEYCDVYGTFKECRGCTSVCQYAEYDLMGVLDEMLNISPNEECTKECATYGLEGLLRNRDYFIVKNNDKGLQEAIKYNREPQMVILINNNAANASSYFYRDCKLAELYFQKCTGYYYRSNNTRSFESIEWLRSQKCDYAIYVY